MSHEPDSFEDGALGLALQDGQGRAYNERAFRYFLTVERLRANRSNRPFSVVLVRPRPRRGHHTSLTPGVSARVFAGLAQSVRETDFLGWYVEGRVAAAVLTEREGAPRAGVADRITTRVRGLLEARLPAPLVAALAVRVIHVQPRAAERRAR